MKHKTIKLIALLILILSIYLVYNFAMKDKTKINYIALGDSLAEGMNSYGEIGYSYADYLRDYLENTKRLGTYSKAFSKSGYKTSDVLNDLNNNRNVEENGKTLNLRRALRESKLVTISIGANDFISELSITNIYTKISDISTSKKEIKKVSENVENLIIEIKKYAKNEIVLLGYYNPLPTITFSHSIDELVKYSNELYKDICMRQDITYVDIFDVFNKNSKYLPNPYDIHPNTQGYESISKEIVKNIKNLLK